MKKETKRLLFTNLIWFLVVLALLFQNAPQRDLVIIPDKEVPLAGSASNYIRADGTKLVDKYGNEFLIRAMGFGNACWSNHDGPTYNYCTEADYENLHNLGFNTVRYYLNYGIFEDDSQPYVYKQSAWDWLDQNVEWARKHNIKILFNMHYPQGGFQSAGDGMNLWLNNNDEQNRLTALWKAIASRYANEEAVLGYGLVNEPFMPWLGDYYTTIVQWKQLAQRLTSAIREEDQNHIIFAEAAFAAKDMNSGQIYHQLNYDKNFVEIADPCKNLVYEAHYYSPSEFTHMLEEAPIDYLNYPDDNIAITEGEIWLGATYNEALDYNTYGQQNEDGWFKVETIPYTITDPSQDVFYVTLGAYGLKWGSAWFDDVSVDLYDERGTYITNVLTFDFNTDQQWYNLYSSDGTGAAVYVGTDGHKGNGCVAITNANGYVSLGKNGPVCVNVKPGYQYKISAWVKTDAPEALLFPQFSFCKGLNKNPYTGTYLLGTISSLKEVTDRWNAPLFMGEFGVLAETYNGHGGELWIADMVNACSTYGVGFSQHIYHAEGFGLYMNSQYLLPADENMILKNIILNVVKPLQTDDADEVWNYD